MTHGFSDFKTQATTSMQVNHEIAVLVAGETLSETSVPSAYQQVIELFCESKLEKYVMQRDRDGRSRFWIHIHKMDELCSGSASISCIDQASAEIVKFRIESESKYPRKFSVTIGYLVTGNEGKKFMTLARTCSSTHDAREVPAVSNRSPPFPSANLPCNAPSRQHSAPARNPYLSQLIESNILTRKSFQHAVDTHNALAKYETSGTLGTLDILVHHLGGGENLKESTSSDVFTKMDEQLRLLKYEANKEEHKNMHKGNPSRTLAPEATETIDHLARKWPPGVKASKGKQIGTVMWYSPTKGYGFIQGSDRQEHFVHQASINRYGFRCLMVGEDVEFVSVREENGGRCVAVEVSGPNRTQVQGSARPRHTAV